MVSLAARKSDWQYKNAAGIRALERLPDGKPRGERLFAFQIFQPSSCEAEWIGVSPHRP